MTMRLNVTEGPVLPHDVLRLVFEEATRDDRRKAAKYTLVCKLVRDWVENCLYSDVRLYSEKALRKFLQTLESSTKPQRFFATRVKTLTIAYDVHNGSECTSKVLHACNGVENLTLWAIPSHSIAKAHSDTHAHYSVPSQRLAYLQPLPPAPPLYCHPRQLHQTLYRAVARHLHPKCLALLVDKPLYIQFTPYSAQAGLAAVLTPNFTLGLFSNVTHLSIVNRWTEWSAWAWSWDNDSPSERGLERLGSLKFLPKLTHLSLEIQVGKNSGRLMPPTFLQQRNQKLAGILCLPLAAILSSPELKPHLRVVLCILSFDDKPHDTASAITEQTNYRLSTVIDERHFHPRQLSYSGLGCKSSDPRLVFAYDREPFKNREAGSSKFWSMWKRAEEIVRLQQDFASKANYHPIIFEP